LPELVGNGIQEKFSCQWRQMLLGTKDTIIAKMIKEEIWWDVITRNINISGSILAV